MNTLRTAFLATALPLALLPAAALAAVAPEKLYEQHCAKCHGKSGEADTWRGIFIFAQDFTKDSFQKNRTDEEILDKINRGPRIMPSYEEKLSRGERTGLVKLIRGFARPAEAEKKQ